MKYLLLFLFFVPVLSVKAQNGDFEIKVVSFKYQTVRGQLKKVSAEGIGVEDYKGNYIIFRPGEIQRLKIRKRGLTVGESTVTGTAIGAGIGLGIWSLDKENFSTGEMLTITGVLTGVGTVAGSIAGVIVEVIHTKLVINVAGDEEKFKSSFKKLEPYVNTAYAEHIN